MSTQASARRSLTFVKMHGIGNDYVYVDLFAHPALPMAADELARRVADRHFGVGGDGLILVGPSTVADLKMSVFNADGSEAQMCGNGIRCAAKLAYDEGHTRKSPLTVETRAGVKTLELTCGADGKVAAARVNMGSPILSPAQVPVKLPGDCAVDVPVSVAERAWRMTCVSMGNPHAVVFVDELLNEAELTRVGRLFEHDAMFPERVNAHVVKVHGRGEVTMQTWERGSGITLACGTGASAVCVAGVLTGRTDRRVLAHLPGGDLELAWDEKSGAVFMTGSATEVFRGVWKA